MKILKIILVSFLILLVLVVIAAVTFIKTFDANRFKPQILAQARSALGRDVDIEKLDLGISLSHGADLRIKGMRIGDDPAFQKADFFTVKNVSLAIDALAYLC